ncbi:4-hydroxy-3-methylbut-2-enyl diphosphate reductase [Spirochaetia bacterium]|nr:4-hydroxy-3-methylbut-2-enyl diphosphate reductase [Spirochaetia bacterium]
MGVRRAVELAEAAVLEAAPIYTAGPLIHNPQVLTSLTERGVQILDETDLNKADRGTDLSGAAVIIRAHGISPKAEQQLRQRGARIIDATCPRVKASQLAARSLADKGRWVFIAGERNHAEVRGIAGYVEKSDDSEQRRPAVIAGNAAEAAAAAEKLYQEAPEAKTALIAQTTFSPEEYAAIAEVIKVFFPGLEVHHTICGATRDRQNALLKLCSAVDAVIIAGGKDSANTRRLLSIAKNCGKPAWLAESAADVNAAELAHFQTLGISAGASTPDSVIDAIEAGLLEGL